MCPYKSDKPHENLWIHLNGLAWLKIPILQHQFQLLCLLDVYLHFKNQYFNLFCFFVCFLYLLFFLSWPLFVLMLDLAKWSQNITRTWQGNTCFLEKKIVVEKLNFLLKKTKQQHLSLGSLQTSLGLPDECFFPYSAITEP